jgi:hypothetical protein
MAGQTHRRHRLLLYQAWLHRYRAPALTLALLLGGLWFPVRYGFIPWPPPSASPWLFAGGITAFASWLVLVVSPTMAYVQVLEDRLRVQTPFLRLYISFRRIHNTRPIQIRKMFPPASLSQRERQWLKPFYGATGLVVELQGWPLNPRLLRLFLNRFMFTNDQSGFLLVVEDWMAVSNQLHSRLDDQRDREETRTRGAQFGTADFLNDNQARLR